MANASAKRRARGRDRTANKGRGEADYISDYRNSKRSKNYEDRDRNYIVSMDLYRPVKPDHDISASGYSNVRISVRIKENDWDRLKHRLLVREPYIHDTRLTRAAMRIPWLLAIPARFMLPKTGDPYIDYAETAGIMLAAGLSEPVMAAIRDQMPYRKKLLKEQWEQNISYSVGGVFQKDSIIEKKLGSPNVDAFSRGLAEAISFAHYYHQSHKGWRALRVQNPQRFVKEYATVVQGFNPAAVNLNPEVDGSESFKFSFNMEVHKPTKNIRTTHRADVDIKIVPDISMHRNEFHRHGLDVLPFREIDEATGEPIEVKDVFLSYPINIQLDQKKQPSRERVNAVRSLMRPQDEFLLKGEKPKPALWFYTQPKQRDVYVTRYMPDDNPMHMNDGVYNVIKGANDWEEGLKQEFKKARKDYILVSKQERMLRRMSKTEDTIEGREEVSKWLEFVERERAKTTPGVFEVFKTQLLSDGLPPDNPRKYTRVFHARTASDFHDYVENEIEGNGFEKDYFWALMKLRISNESLEYSDQFERDVSRTIQTQRDNGVEYFIESRKGGCYALRDFGNGEAELRVSTLLASMLPKSYNSMEILIPRSAKKNAMTKLAEMRPNLIEKPYEHLEAYLDYMKKEVARQQLLKDESTEPEKFALSMIEQDNGQPGL